MDGTTKRCMETSPDDDSKLGDFECEDDNSSPGDGCFNGFIEEGWTCDGGDENDKDRCSRIAPIEVVEETWDPDSL